MPVHGWLSTRAYPSSNGCRMPLHAYILAADPTWLTASVSSYYAAVDRIIVSYDRDGIGYTGVPVPVDECVRRLREVDLEGKMRFCPGRFARRHPDPHASETEQRRAALSEASDGADWVLQIDTDEVLPNPAALIDMLRRADELGLDAVEWPMRVLFRRLGDGRYLEVCAAGARDRFEYPGPIAVRPGVRLVVGRRTDGPFLRPVVRGDAHSLQIVRPAEDGERRVEGLEPLDAILHNSWARTAANVRAKIATWSHSNGWKSQLFYYLRWRPAPYLWPWMRDFHPFARGLWPALKPVDGPLQVAPSTVGATSADGLPQSP